MATGFRLEILTPAKVVCRETVSEVVLPAYDGETGVLPSHGDFIGVLGTGVLKLVRGGDDYWYMVSSGVYEVKNGAVTIFADLAESASDVDIEETESRAKEASEKLAEPGELSIEELESLQRLQKLTEARLEVHRRTSLMN